MAAKNLTIAHEEFQSIVLTASWANGAGADIVDNLRFPTGGVKTYICSKCSIHVYGIATPHANPELLGVSIQKAFISDMSVQGVRKHWGTFSQYGTGNWALYFERVGFDINALNECLLIYIPEIDTNVSPTGDILLYLECLKIS